MTAKWTRGIEVAAGTDDRPALPAWSKSGVPYCDDRCPHSDGKRCEILGQRPDGICEPAVEAMAREAGRADEAVAEMQLLSRAFCDLNEELVALEKGEAEGLCACCRAREAEPDRARCAICWGHVKGVVEVATAGLRKRVIARLRDKENDATLSVTIAYAGEIFEGEAGGAT